MQVSPTTPSSSSSYRSANSLSSTRAHWNSLSASRIRTFGSKLGIWGNLKSGIQDYFQRHSPSRWSMSGIPEDTWFAYFIGTPTHVYWPAHRKKWLGLSGCNFVAGRSLGFAVLIWKEDGCIFGKRSWWGVSFSVNFGRSCKTSHSGNLSTYRGPQRADYTLCRLLYCYTVPFILCYGGDFLLDWHH